MKTLGMQMMFETTTHNGERMQLLVEFKLKERKEN
jgi:hypothetical protein